MDLSDKIKEIKALIEKDKLDFALKELKNITLSTDFEDEIIIQTALLNRARSDNRSQLITTEEFQIKLNRININLLDLCKRFELGFLQIKTKDSGLSMNPNQLIEKFDYVIDDKIENFIGREWLLNEIYGTIQSSNKGYFVIEGEPGIGKSAIASKVIKDYKGDCVYHFNIRSTGNNNSHHFFKNIIAQLILNYNLTNYKITSASLQDGVLFMNLLNEISKFLKDESRKLLIVIDALDEVKRNPTLHEGNILYLPENLPENIFILITYRIGSNLKLKINPILKFEKLNQVNKLNQEDATKFIEKYVPIAAMQNFIRFNKLSDEEFVNILLNRSHHNFMYLRHVINEILKGFYKDLDIDEIPIGLQNYYEDHWSRMKSMDPEKWHEVNLPIITLLAIAKRPLAVETISKISEVELNSVRLTIEAWLEFIYKEYFKGKLPVYRIYHMAYSDFLSKKDEITEELNFTSMGEKYINYLMQWK